MSHNVRLRDMLDASYVALAELLDLTLFTLDRDIARTPDLGCTVLSP